MTPVIGPMTVADALDVSSERDVALWARCKGHEGWTPDHLRNAALDVLAVEVQRLAQALREAEVESLKLDLADRDRRLAEIAREAQSIMPPDGFWQVDAACSSATIRRIHAIATEVPHA